MKKFLLFFSAVVMLLTSCEGMGEGAKQQAIKLTSKDTVSVGCGSTMGYVAYELVTPIEGVSVVATSNVEWIGNFDYKQMGKIMYNVDANGSEDSREGVITVTYDQSSFSVVVKQAGNPVPTDKKVEMPHLMGSYYGIQSGMYNYYLSFTDIAENNEYSTPNAKYYFVDLYIMEKPADMDNITVPVGEYTYDKSNSGIPGTFTETYSWYQVTPEDGYVYQENQISFESGKLIVEEGKVTLKVTLNVDGVLETHTVVYEGDYSLKNEA